MNHIRVPALAAAATAIVIVILLATASALSSRPAFAGNRATIRAMWIWKTPALLTKSGEIDRFVAALQAASVTEVYLFLRTAEYAILENRLRVLLAALSKAGIKAWGMEGWRGYFSDVDGPAALYAAADALVNYNSRNADKFVGFHSDMEPQDGQGEGRSLFHNTVAQSQLTSAQLADRDKILSEWLQIHETLLNKMTAAGLRYGGAMPSWVDDYYGEPVQVVFRGARRPLLEHLMPLVPQYVIMSYNTSPANIVNQIVGELQFADTLPNKPQVLFGVETHAGAGANTSYADTPPKNNKRAVVADIEAVEAGVATFQSFAGSAIHDWEGWKDLPSFE